MDATIFQDIYSTTTLQIENRKQQLSKALIQIKTLYIHTYFYSKRTATPNIFINWMNSGLNPNLDCENFRNSHVSNLSNFYPQIKHLYSPPRFSMVFQIWSPWCFCFPTLLHLRIFWKRKCFFFFFRVKNCMLNLVMLGGHFPSKSSQTNSHSKPPWTRWRGAWYKPRWRKKQRAEPQIRSRDFPAEEFPKNSEADVTY